MNDADERLVAVVAEGAPDDLDELERRLWQGPSGARVERVDAERGPASGKYASRSAAGDGRPRHLGS